MTQPANATAELRALAAILRSGEWTRAVVLAAASASPLRVTVGGGGSVGGHSDPTATAALARPDPIPRAATLRSALRVVGRHLGLGPGPHFEARVATRLEATAEVDRRLLAAVQATLTLHARVITPTAVADWLLSQEQTVTGEKARVTACEACEQPAHHTSKIRNGWCDACYALSRAWVQTRPDLIDDDLALDVQRFNHAVAQAVASGELDRAHSPLRRDR